MRQQKQLVCYNVHTHGSLVYILFTIEQLHLPENIVLECVIYAAVLLALIMSITG
jgi:hypothetical protein